MLQPTLALLLACAVASAEAPAVDVARSFYLLQTGRAEEAAWNAAAALHVDPADLVAHRAYIFAMARGLREGPRVTALYRAWAAEEDSPASRLGLALALQYSSDRMGPWCDELEAALEGLDGWDPEARYWGHRSRYEARATCPGDRGEDREALLALGDEVERAFGYGLRLRLADGDVDAALADDLGRWYALAPALLSYPGNLWREALTGQALERARREALEAAIGVGMGSEDPWAVHNARAVLGWAEHEDAAAVEARLALLDPARGRTFYRHSGAARWMMREVQSPSPTRLAIYSASRKHAARAARLLRQLEPPEDGATLALHQQKLAENLEATGRRGPAVDAYRRAWEADPSPERANAYAYAARDTDPQGALAAMDAALAAERVWDPRGDHALEDYEAWLRQERALRATWLDTRGWVLHAAGRDQEAAADLRGAVLLDPAPSALHHLHLGIVYHALGRREEALHHLGRGLSMAEDLPWSERATRASARGLARELYREQRWAPGGLDDWIASQRPLERSPIDGPPEQTEADYRLGQPFPDLRFERDGVEQRLSDYPGLVVVDLWATWCGPCVSALPHLSQVARETPEVTVLAISVDRERGALDDFSKRPPRPAYVEVWAGAEAQKLAKVQGIPAVFVVRDGVVVGYYSGWRRDDDRLERILAEQR